MAPFGKGGGRKDRGIFASNRHFHKRRKVAKFGIQSSNLSVFAPLREILFYSSNLQPVKVYWVVVQDCFLVLVVDVVAFEKFRDVALEHIR